MVFTVGRKKRRLAQIDHQCSLLLRRVNDEGPACQAACLRGVLFAFTLAQEKKVDGWSERQIFALLTDKGMPLAGKPSCEGLGFGLVSFMYECRAMRSREALRLAARISDQIASILINAIDERHWK